MNTFQIYKRLLKYVLPYRWVFILGLLGMIVVAISEASFAALLKPIMDGGFVDRDTTVIKLTPLLLVGAFMARGVGSFADQYSIGWIARMVIADLRSELFEKMIQLPVPYHDHETSASLVAKLIYDIEQVAQAATLAIRVLVKDALLTLALLGWLIYLNWQLTVIFLTITPVAAVIIRVAGRRFRTVSERIQESIGNIAQVSKEAFQAHKILKSFKAYRHETVSFERVNLSNRDQAIKKAVIGAGSVPLVLIFVGMNVAGVIYLAMTGATGSFISAGTFASYLGAILMLMAPIKRLAMVNELLQTGVAASKSAFDILDMESESDGGRHIMSPAFGNLEFRNVSFTYSSSNTAALNNVSFSISQGDFVGIVGESGSGKSTISSLLVAFYDTFCGEILIDGVSISEHSVGSLREEISLAPQDATLFNDTLIRNICYGADTDKGRLEAVIEATGIDRFIPDLPDGLETNIGERGALLSGGQRQRVALARALYREFSILIMDEATSGIDNIGEEELRRNIRNFVGKRTVLAISHRLSTVVDADCIYVLHQGRLIESGDHETLVAMGGYYGALYSNQMNSAQLTQHTLDRTSE
ncbi:MAG: lipid ABC transporter permease/ATP-binding protein [Acidiferrobacteraceae bacterium]|nr:lipid ABC transporter permease/ATP-binding protein [Acidiferrobacteraceae bacterium]